MFGQNWSRRLFHAAGLITLLALVSGCGGLSAEPQIVTTLIPAPDVSSATVTSPPATAQPVSVPVTSGGSATPVVAQAVTATTVAAVPAATATSGVVKTEDAAAVTGTVNGHVTNGTASGVVPPGLKVTLHIIDQTTGETTLDTVIDANGDFSFKEVPIRAGATYGVTTIYQDRQLVSDGVTGDPTVKVMTFALKLYEVTSDPAVLSITSMVTRVNATTDGLQVAEVVRFTNKSDRLYTTAQRLNGQDYGSVSLSLPAGASLMGFSDSSDRFILAADGKSFTDTLPVLPNEDHVVHFVYTLPYQENGTPIELPVGYPVEGTVQLLLSPSSLNASSQQLLPLGVQTVGGTDFQAYGGQIALKAGDILRFEVSGKLDASSGSSPFAGREMVIGILVGMGIAAIVIGVVLLVRDQLGPKLPARPHGTARKSPKPGTESAQAQIQNLISQLARLDEQREQGKIGKAAYNRQRSTLKMQLAELMKE